LQSLSECRSVSARKTCGLAVFRPQILRTIERRCSLSPMCHGDGARIRPPSEQGVAMGIWYRFGAHKADAEQRFHRQAERRQRMPERVV